MTQTGFHGQLRRCIGSASAAATGLDFPAARLGPLQPRRHQASFRTESPCPSRRSAAPCNSGQWPRPSCTGGGARGIGAEMRLRRSSQRSLPPAMAPQVHHRRPAARHGDASHRAPASARRFRQPAATDVNALDPRRAWPLTLADGRTPVSTRMPAPRASSASGPVASHCGHRQRPAPQAPPRSSARAVR